MGGATLTGDISATPEPSAAVADNIRPILEMKGISKYFGHVKALENADFEVYPQEVVALVGDNGAGKSTLIKILSGVYLPDSGDIYIDNTLVSIRSPQDAQAQGMATVYQDLALVDCLDVASNLFLGREPTRGIMVDRRKMVGESREILRRLRINISSVELIVGYLSGGQRQALAIGRAVSRAGRILIMDEPTAALGVEESQKALQLIEQLKAQGSSIVVISHNLAHVFSVADRIVVLRHGKRVGSRRKADTTTEEIVAMITGAYAPDPQ